MRTITIVQGLTILTASVYMLHDGQGSFHLVAFFGLAFTVVLALQQRNYLKDFECHLEKIDILEEGVLEEGETFWGEGKKGPWATYKKRHNEQREGGAWWWSYRFRLFVEFGPSVLFGSAFIWLVHLKYGMPIIFIIVLFVILIAAFFLKFLYDEYAKQCD